ncbi:MAG: Hsp20/alpha crystallin family protein [Ignavibacteriaceae bacterium]|jgi:HSP20 family protein
MSDNKDLVKVEVKNEENWEQTFEQECLCAPQVDIYEIEDEFVMSVNLPGVSKEKIRIKIEDSHLIIMAKNDIGDIQKRNYILSESTIGNYFRKFKVSDSINLDKIVAKYTNGQLVINLPKQEFAKPRTIEIK